MKTIIDLLKNFLDYGYYKYHRLKYFFLYGIPFIDKKIDSTRIVNFLDWVGPIENAAIIGKGASIYESDPKKLIQSCDFKCVLNSVDIEHLEPFIGSSVDAQMTTRAGLVNSLMPVLPKRILKKYGIKLLICNSTMNYANGTAIKTYWDFFNNRVDNISYMLENDELEFDVDTKQYSERGRLTIASSLLRMLYNIKTLNKIVFAGVDAFHFPYAYREGVKQTDKVFYPMNAASEDPRNTHGLPFLRFLFDTLKLINQERKLDAYFPVILKKHIDFPDVNYIKFYS